MKISSQKILLVISVIFFLPCLMVFGFLYREINSNNKEAGEGRATWQAETERRNNIRTLDKTLQKISPEIANLDAHFAKSSDVVPFLDTIEKLGPIAGAKAEVMSVEVPAGSSSLVVGLKASGSFSSVYKFLTLLENSPYELDFLWADLQKTGTSEEGGGSWEAIFRMRLLSFIP